MSLPIIWVDADSCPKLIRTYLLKYSKQLNLEIRFVANHIISKELITEKNFTMIICDNSKDAADNYILNNTNLFDIVITRDILFASRLLKKKITVINDRGIKFTPDNIQERLYERDFSLQLSSIGLGSNKKNIYSNREFNNFTKTFNYEIHKLLDTSLTHSI